MANAEPRGAVPTASPWPPTPVMAQAGRADTLHQLPPAVPALGLHLPLWAAILAICHGLGSACSLGPIGLTWVEGITAWAVTRWLGLPRWWQPINLLFSHCLASPF